MKKSILTFLFLLIVSISTFAQTAWTTIMSEGFINLTGSTFYDSGQCLGANGSDPVLRPLAYDPFSYVICNPVNHTAYFRNCPEGLAFNPSSLTCDWISNVHNYYPEFPWGIIQINAIFITNNC